MFDNDKQFIDALKEMQRLGTQMQTFERRYQSLQHDGFPVSVDLVTFLPEREEYVRNAKAFYKAARVFELYAPTVLALLEKQKSSAEYRYLVTSIGEQ